MYHMNSRTSMLLAAALIGLLSQAVGAAELYWDANGATAGAGATPTGTWGIDNYWNSDSTGGGGGYFTAETSIGDALTFCAGADAQGPTSVAVNGTQWAKSLTFFHGRIALGGGTVGLLDGNIRVDTDASITPLMAGEAAALPYANATIHSVVGGSSGLTKLGQGTLTLTNTNIYSGNTTIKAGTLVFSAGALGTGNIYLTPTQPGASDDGVTLRYAAGNTEDISGRLVVQAGNVGLSNLDIGANNVTFAAPLNIESGILYKYGAGALNLAAAPNIGASRTFSVLQGAVNISANCNVGGNLYVYNPGGVLTITGNNTLNVVAATSSGVLNLSGNNSITGSVQASLGTANLTGGNAFISTAYVQLSSGTLNVGNANALNFGALRTGGNITHTGTSYIDNTSGAPIALSGSFRFQGSGTLVCKNTHDLDFGAGSQFSLPSGATSTVTLQIDQGTTTVGVLRRAGRLDKTGPGTLVIAADAATGSGEWASGNKTITAGTLQVGVGGTAGSLFSGATYPATATLTNNGSFVYNRSDEVSFPNPISGSGIVTQMGTGTLTLSGNNSYLGQTIVKAGAIQLEGTAAQSRVLGVGGADIQAGKMVFTYSTTPPNVLPLLTASYNGGQWNAGQFRSTTADANHGLGWADDAAGKVTIRYTRYGDADLDGDVDNSDFGAVYGSFTGPGGTGKVWAAGDFDYDGDVDNSDFGAVYGNFTGPGAKMMKSALAGGSPSIADLLYDPATGNVKLDATQAAGGVITNFVLNNAAGGADFITSAVNFPPNLGIKTNLPTEISYTDLTMAGFSGVWDLGNICPTGFNETSLAAWLTKATYVGSLGSGQHAFDLVVVSVPEPGTLILLASGLVGLLTYARRKRR